MYSITDFEGAPDTISIEARDHASDTARGGGNDVCRRGVNNDTTDVNDETIDANDDTPDINDARGDDAPRGSRRSAGIRPGDAVLGYALLFSLPVGVGVAVMLLRVTGSRPNDAIVFAPSLALAAAVFLLVVAIGSGGSPEP
ncbi:hypothetical protein [Halobellus captivus]|uniref:hypothetical protein n=1 Tax=Halobellus captivus TaxID=2592614 RepID=UPI001EEF792F|nr:hypothetical protein [Halobellus captivus]